MTWTRRDVLVKGTGTALALGAGGLTWRGFAQETRNGSLARGMITEPTQAAIDQGLEYLARAQRPGGELGTGMFEGNSAIAGLAGLAFLAGGHQPGRGRYGTNVTRLVEYLLSIEDTVQFPGFLNNVRGHNHGAMYCHGFATLFLAEVYGMINEARLRDRLSATLHRAVRLIIQSQNSEGGWRYQPRAVDADLSVTICQIMALRAARNAGVAVPKSTADRCIQYVKECQDIRGTGAFRYQRTGGNTSFALTAAGVVALYNAGIYDDDSIKKGLAYLNNARPTAQGNNIFNQHYHYGHYYAVQAMWIAGGDYWAQWYPRIRDELLAQRNAQGHWSQGLFCPHYCTAMALIILQVPNGYLPILHR